MSPLIKLAMEQGWESLNLEEIAREDGWDPKSGRPMSDYLEFPAREYLATSVQYLLGDTLGHIRWLRQQDWSKATVESYQEVFDNDIYQDPYYALGTFSADPALEIERLKARLAELEGAA